MLDGVNITDPVTGTFSLNFNFDAIEQIQVLTSAFDPEYGQNLGGVINVLTDSGGNTLEFIQDVRYQNGEWGPKLDGTYAADGTLLAPTDFESRYSNYRINTKISGPIIRDRAWFVFSYGQSRSLISSAGNPVPRDYEGHYVFGKLTVQPNTAHKLTVSLQSDPTTVDNVYQSSRFILPEAQGRQAQGGFYASGQWDWFITPESFLETKAAVQKSFIERTGVPCTHDRDLGYNPCETDEVENQIDYVTVGRLGSYGAYDSGNDVIMNFDDRWRFVLSTKVSVLQIQALGTHDVKAGLSTDVLWWDRQVGYTGNMFYVDLNELDYNPDTFANYYWREFSDPLQYSTAANQIGFYFTDTYKPVTNVTVLWGTRYDHAVFRNDVGERVIDVGVFGPRFSLIWDPWSNAKTKIVASAGRFNNPGRIGIADYLSQADIGNKLIVGEWNFNNFTSGADNTYYYVPVENTNSIDDNTTVPHTDELLVGVERELIRDLAIKLYFNGKFTQNIHAFDETNLMWDGEGYNIVGSVDGSFVSQYRLRTPEIAQRIYTRGDVTLEKVWSDLWEAQINYSYTHSRGTSQGQMSDFLSVPQQTEYFINGNLGTDIRHDVSAAFAWELPTDPWTTNLGAVFRLESGYPISRTYANGNSMDYGRGYFLKQTIGTYARTETWFQLDLQFKQAIPVRKGKLEAVAALENITNNRAGQYAYVNGEDRWIISSRNAPVRFQLGGRYEF